MKVALQLVVHQNKYSVTGDEKIFLKNKKLDRVPKKSTPVSRFPCLYKEAGDGG